MSANVRNELMKIHNQHGVLTPYLVVDEARDPAHPLHSRFEWDDSEAAEKYRRVQARKLIGIARVTYAEGSETTPEKSVRAFHSVPASDGNGNVYEPSEKIARDPILSELKLREFDRDWKAFRRRYADFEDFWKLIQREIEQRGHGHE